MHDVVRRFADLAVRVREQRPAGTESGLTRLRLVGVDGLGGAGKTTFAGRLAAAGGGWPVVHTDDFASHQEPLEWWPRMLHEVIEPLSRNETARFHPYDWVARQVGAVEIAIPASPVVVIEGVGASRRAWRDRLTLAVWVDTPREVRLARGLARDGADMLGFWQWWMAAEDRYVETDRPYAAADVVVDGDSATPHDRSEEFVEMTLSAPR